MKTACQYAVIRFLPYLETGEFANVGVLLCAPKTGFWGFKLAPERFSRVTNFFGELDSKVYRKAIENFRKELEETKDLAIRKNKNEILEFAREITRLRESLISFSELRACMVDSPDKALRDLYDRYVGRNVVDIVDRAEKENTN